MLLDYLLIAFRNLKKRRTRTGLTLIGIFIGIATVVSLISLGQGLQESIIQQFQSLGSDKLIISPGGGSGLSGQTLGSETNKLTDKDVEIIRGTKGVKEVSFYVYGIAGIKFKDTIKYTWIIGLPLDSSKSILESMQNWDIKDGRDLRQGDKYKATVGSELWRGRYFPEKVGIGNKIEIGTGEFRVVGTITPIGNPSDDSQVYIPFDIAREIFNKKDAVDMIIVQADEGINVNEVKADIEKALRRYRKVKEGEEDFSVLTTEQMLEIFSVIFNAVQVVFIGIAAISLIVGGIGIMNTMYTSVLERTNEIGIMKAIGARNSFIMLIFLIESGLLGLVGGAIGIGLGIGLSKGMEVIISTTLGITYLKAYFPLYLIIGSLFFSFIVGCISGVFPAMRAAKQSPVDSLRYE
jgi:putative ABC transport system permease protein